MPWSCSCMENKLSIQERHPSYFVDKAFQSFAMEPGGGKHCIVDCYFINNTDGSIRWIWPRSARQPNFLRFYHAGSRKAKIFAAFARLTFKFRLPQMMATGRCCVTIPESAIGQMKHKSAWALFTGTAGPNRKLVLWYTSNDDKSIFAKCAFGEMSAAILDKEQEALCQVKKRSLQHIIVPEIQASFEGGFHQCDVASGTSMAGPSIVHWPQKAASEWLAGQVHYKVLDETFFYNETKSKLQSMSWMNDDRIPSAISERLRLLFDALRTNEKVPVAPAHGDCTPWNTRIKGNQVAMIDWELYRPEASALFDFFHYEYQSAILMGNKGFTAIRESIDAQMNTPFWKELIHHNHLNIASLEQLYLLQNITYYLQVYHQQQDWHMQVYWLLQTWNDALSFWLAKAKLEEDRRLVLQDLGAFLHKRPHAAMKLKIEHITQLAESSDLDLCLARPDAMALRQYLQAHPLVKQILVSSRSNMMQLTAILADNSLLHVDAIWQFKRKAVDFLNADHVLKTASWSASGLKQPLFLYDFLYTWLFYFLNNAHTPEHYWKEWKDAQESDKQSVINYLEEHTGRRLSGLDELRAPSDEWKKAILRWISQRQPNRGAEKRANQIQYLWDGVKTAVSKRGMVVTFSGVDGAGKSTIIEAVRQRVEKQLRRKVVVLRHRPSLLPILSSWMYGKEAAEQKAASTLPRQGTNKSRIGSLLRFTYYYADYLFGQFYVYGKFVMRGYVVLYDRYYFDFINDSVRSNIRLPRPLVAAGYKLLLKPKLNFFLYASPEEILARKQELNADAITSLTSRYMELFESLTRKYSHSSYLTVYNASMDKTLKTVFDRIQMAA